MNRRVERRLDKIVRSSVFEIGIETEEKVEVGDVG